MANRYWVGGTGTWDGTSTTNWSTATGLSFTASCSGTALTTTGSPALVVGMTVWSSTHVSLGTIVSGSLNSWVVTVGGTYASQSMSAATVGASVPTAADSVFFNANSNSGTTNFTVTMATTPRLCNDFTASGLDGTMTLAGTSIGLTVSGSLTFQATNFTRSYTGTTTFNATTTGKTITTNGVAFGGDVTFNGVGGGWTLSAALDCGFNTLTLTNGTFSTSASNYAITAGDFSSNNANARTLTLNASTVTLSFSGFDAGTSTNFTLNAGTSTIVISGIIGSFDGGGLTYSTVSFTSTTSSGRRNIVSANTFTNLNISTPTVAACSPIMFSANQTITGTLTATGANGYQRLWLSSGDILGPTYGTSITLTCAAIAAMSDVDFNDITIAGAHGTLSGTRLGDCGGNSNITFVAGANKYWNVAAGGNWGATSWTTVSGGAVSDTFYPVPQDTVNIVNTGLTAGNAITINAPYNIGPFTTATRSTAMTLTNGAGGNTPAFYGNFTLSSSVTTSGGGEFTFSNRATKTLNSAGVTFNYSIQINAPGGGVQLLTNNLTVAATEKITLEQGTFDLNNLTVTTGQFDSNNSNTRTLAFGTGNISCSAAGTLSGSTPWYMSTGTNLTVTGTPVVNITSSGSTAITIYLPSLSEANSISFNFTGGTYALGFLNGSGDTAKNVDFTGFAGTWNATSTGTIYGNLKLSTGMTLTASTSAMTFGATSGTKTITSNGKTMDFPLTFNGVGGTWQLQDALTMGSTRAMTLTNGTLDLNGKTSTVGTRFTTATGTKNLTFNGGTLVCPDTNTTAFNNASPTNFTTTAGTGTGTISMTSASAKTFVGGGSTFNCVLNQGGTGTLTITGSNTFSNITNTVQPSQLTFTAGTTTTVTSFSLAGTAGNLTTLRSSTPGTQYTLSDASGTTSTSYLDIQDNVATGGATWRALATNGNVNSGNNNGWDFGAGSANFLMLF